MLFCFSATFSELLFAMEKGTRIGQNIHEGMCSGIPGLTVSGISAPQSRLLSFPQQNEEKNQKGKSQLTHG